MSEPKANDVRAIEVDIDSLSRALIAAQGEFGAVTAGTENTFFKSKYADFAAVKAVAQPVLTKYGLGVTQEPGFLVVGEKILDTLVTTILHASGQERSSTMVLKPAKPDPQGQGSAITYAKRYAFMAVLGLVADADDDGNAASGNGRPKAAAKAAPTAEEVAAGKVAKAIANVKAAAKKAGATPAEATALYAEKNAGASFSASTDLAALKVMYDHYTAISNVKSELGGTEVAQ